MENHLQNIVDYTTTTLPALQAMFVQYALSIFGAVFILFVGWAIAQLLGKWSYAALSRIHGIDETIAGFFSNFIRYLVILIIIVMVLGQFGVQTASIVAALGAAGVAIGLALQGTLQNIAAGIMLLVLRPFRVGEYIETGAVSGVVQFIGLFTTELKTVDGLYRVAPNSLLWNVQITNFSRLKQRRNDIAVSVNEGSDVEAAAEILKSFAEKDRRVLRNPAPQIFISAISGATTSLTLRYWTASSDFSPVQNDLLKAAKPAFNEKEIKIA